MTTNPKYKILVIDDDTSRQSWFGTQFKLFKTPVVCAHAFNDLQALQYMKENEFDLVFFDHDLGVGMNGSQIAYEILQNDMDYNIPKHVWSQSENPVGVKNIFDKFRSYNRSLESFRGPNDKEITTYRCSFSTILSDFRYDSDSFENQVMYILEKNETK